MNETPEDDDISAQLAAEDALARLSRSNVGFLVSSLAKQLAQNIKRKEELEDLLSTVNSAINGLKTNALPEALGIMGARNFTTDDDIYVEVKDVVQGSLPKDERRPLALEWFEERGLGDVIKHTVTVQINKGDIDTQRRVLQALKPFNIGVATKDDIHPQTLNATLRDLLGRGVAVPLDLFNVFVGKTINIKIKE